MKKLSLANAIVAAARPRSYISPLLFGTGIYMHRIFGSRSVIDYLCAMGFSISYKEIMKFEASAVSQSQYQLSQNAYQQFIFDNADFNTKTLDGYGTFHCMGGIVCISPESTCTFPNKIHRPKQSPKAELTGKFGFIPVVQYKKRHQGLKSIAIKNIELTIDAEKLHQLKLHNSLWMSAYYFSFPRQVPWNGFMSATVNGTFEVTRVLAIPFINLDPGNLATIYSALRFAAEQVQKQGQKYCFVTFDQPLYIKAVDMVTAAEETDILQRLIIRLGGFHMLMSFLGSIGYLMAESGLEELWNVIYAKNSIPAMLNGHSFSRSLRAHFLTQLAISLLALKDFSLDTESIKALQLLYEDEEQDYAGTPVETVYREVRNRFVRYIEKSKTCKLWIQYWDLVELVKNFIRAERSSDFELHLYCVRQMLPVFYATGHLHYAKSSHLYLQQMISLSETLPLDEYQRFLQYFSIRRTSEKFWSGVWTDMSIEQVLMRALKAQGGLTRGRGLTDSVLAKWVSAMPDCPKISDAAETFTGSKTKFSEQHVELRDSREVRDLRDINKFSRMATNSLAF